MMVILACWFAGLCVVLAVQRRRADRKLDGFHRATLVWNNWWAKEFQRSKALLAQSRLWKREADKQKGRFLTSERDFKDAMNLYRDAIHERSSWRHKFDHSESANKAMLVRVTALEAKIERMKGRKGKKR